MSCACRVKYEAMISPEAVELLGNRPALFARLAEGPDVSFPTFSPSCFQPCAEAAEVVRTIAMARL